MMQLPPQLHSHRGDELSNKKLMVTKYIIGKTIVAVAVSLGVILLAAMLVGSLFIGDVRVDGATVYDAFFRYNQESVSHIIVRDSRLPRAMADILVGAALAVAGAIMQAITRNPLASPGIMGLNTGASFATVMLMAIAPTAGRPELMLVSIAGATLGATLVYGLASLSPGGLTPVRLALTGIAVSALLGAIGNGVMIYNQLGQDVLFWYARGTEDVQWFDLSLFLPLAGVGLLGAYVVAPSLSILTLGDHVARGLGQRTKTAKLLAGVIVLVLAGGAVSLAGPVGFIGLMIPHVVRHFVGQNYRFVIPASAIGGAILMLAADLGARLTTSPLQTPMPVGVITALLGVPFFLYLACRKQTTVRGGCR
jgi:iron complex transport system permease protein